MKPVAYFTPDRKMLIPADSPNMLPNDLSTLIPLFERDNTNECDRAYVWGLKAGYSLGQTNNEEEFQETIERYKRKEGEE